MSTYTYIVDFDDCLFDTARLKTVLDEYGIDQHERGDTTLLRAHEDMLTHVPDLRSFLFPDAHDWLQENGANCHIVTSFMSHAEGAGVDEYSLRMFQEAKLKAAAIYEYVAPERVHIVGSDKSAMLRDVHRTHEDTPLFFIDNHPDHLHAGQAIGVTPVQIVREARRLAEDSIVSEHVSWPIIYSFSELNALTTWLFSDT